jgi:hypothetical protein
MSDTFGAARAFEMKLKQFWKQLEDVNLCHFASCELLRKDDQYSLSECLCCRYVSFIG